MAGTAIKLVSERMIATALRDVPLGGLHFFETIDSTNDHGLRWASEGAPDMALVIANEQTAGRGRGSRSWYTPADSALAFSLVLRPTPGEGTSVPLFSGLGALAVCLAVAGRYGIQPAIKWPNDVLIRRRKFCGILAETSWIGEQAESIILGIGLNVTARAVPPAELINFPATSLEAEIGIIPDRIILLHDILVQFLKWRSRITTAGFIAAWDERLAFKGELVEVRGDAGEGILGRVDGLEADGSLRLKQADGLFTTVQFGEVHLRLGI